MKFQLIFGVLFAVLLVQIRSEEWNDNDEYCAQKLNLKKIVLQPFEDRQVVPVDNDDFNKFLTCSWKKAGIISDDNEINWDVIDEHFEKQFKADIAQYPEITSVVVAAAIDTAVENCRTKNLQGSILEQTAVVIRNCIADEVVRQVMSLLE